MSVIVSVIPEDRFAASKVTLPPGWTLRFPRSAADAEIAAACRGARYLLAAGSTAKLRAGILENLPDIKLIQTIGVGVDHIDIPASVRLGIAVANVPGQNATSVAEYTIGAIIALQRRIIEADREIKAGNYVAYRHKLLSTGLREIRGSSLGLIGFGSIGQEVAKLAVLLGASVSYHALHQQPAAVEARFAVEFKPLEALLAASDIISLHVPSNERTKGLLGARELALMPAGSLLINTARGDIVDQAMLAEALEAGRLAGAAIDTISPEPPGPDHPFFKLSAAAQNRLLLTPHISGATAPSFKRMIEAAIANIVRFDNGEKLLNQVNEVPTNI